MRRKNMPRLALALGAAAAGVAVIGGSASATPNSGVTTTILAQAPVPALGISSHARLSDWRLRLRTHGVSDGYVVDNVIAPGGTTGWHSHPGPSLIFVVRGAVTNYDSDDATCSGQAYPAGSSFVDPGGLDVHMLRNNGDVPAETIAVQLLPAGAPRRIDAPAPLACPS